MGVGTNTTYFVGGYYEVTNGTVTKYYYAGAQRIAMRTNGTLNYLLGDHLGSTSLTTDATGVVISELRYKAWGEVRYASGNTPTKYTFTGQYSYTSDFGLMFYNARWVDVSLSRFAQADIVVPNSIQGLDRFAYVGNNPVRYTDPSGHCRMDAKADDCLKADRSNAPTLSGALTEFGINSDGMTTEQKKNALAAADNFGRFFYQTYGPQYGFSSPQDAFKKITGGSVSITADSSRVSKDCVTEGSQITCHPDAMTMVSFMHEYFHVFDNQYRAKSTVDDTSCDPPRGGCSIYDYIPQSWVNDENYYKYAYMCDDFPCISHPKWLGNDTWGPHEALANAGQNWILEVLNINPETSGFASNQYGNDIRDGMNRIISERLFWMFNP